MKIPVEFACSALPLAGQYALSGLHDEKICEALAASPLTDVQVIDKMFSDLEGGSFARSRTYSRITDKQQLAEAVANYSRFLWLDGSTANKGTHSRAENSCRNVLTPSDTLTEALGNSDSHIALSAYLNPSTPEKERRKLTAERADTIINFGAKREWASHACELVIANPWMVETPTKWGTTIRCAIVRSPDLTEETLKALNWPEAMSKKDIRNMEIVHNTNTTVDMLSAAQWAGSHIQALDHPDFTIQHAATILQREGDVAPHVVGRIVNRYGLPILFKYRGPRGRRHIDLCHNGRSAAIAWLAPVMEFKKHCGNMRLVITEVCKTLGDNRDNWDTFLVLLPEWDGSAIDAARAVVKL